MLMLVMVVVSLAGCASQPLPERPEAGQIGEGVCHVHLKGMTRRTVERSYGLRDMDEELARFLLHPNAAESLGDCFAVDPPERDRVWVCPACLRARRDFVTLSRTDPEAWNAIVERQRERWDQSLGGRRR